MPRRKKGLTREEKKVEFVNSIKELIERDKSFNYDIADLLSILKETISSVLNKKYKTEKNFMILIDKDEGKIVILRRREIVDDLDVEDPGTQIAISEALQIDPEATIGEYITEEIDFSFFTRKDINSFKQSLTSRLRALQHKKTWEKYEPLVGRIITGEVYKTDYKIKYSSGRYAPVKKGILVKHEKQDVFLPYEELNPGEYQRIERDFRQRKAETVKAVIKEIRVDSSKTPIIILSRKDESFIKELFRLEVPEIEDGSIAIRKIARIPGRRTKIVVESLDDRIDPVGACVGVRGSRISNIVKELNNEKIDIIPHTDNLELFIERALTPARVSKVEIVEVKNERGEMEKVALVYVPNEEERGKAIGEKAVNLRLVRRLTGGYKIKVKVEGEEFIEDIKIEQFNDVISEEDLEKLQKAGFVTARTVLATPIEEVHRQTRIDIEKLKDYYKAMEDEFKK